MDLLGEDARDFCRQDGAPAFRTVYDWLDKDREFSARFARAREAGEDVIAQECLEIADDGTNDYMTITKGDETYNVEDREVTSRSKLRVETRLKLLAKWNPKKVRGKGSPRCGRQRFTRESPKQCPQAQALKNR